MPTDGPSPGPIAARTFDLGFKVAAVAGVACVLALYWLGGLSHTSPADVVLTLALFPVYLLAVAVALGLWLGYDTGPSDLVRVVKEIDADSAEKKDRP